ncbi:MAG: hypothetical protein CMJ32_04310 [Phycisphaerae bacterium]|nr:hypothetical protein [Phycisphaerae bacterium]
MKICLVYNPISGSGKGRADAEMLQEGLQGCGHEVHTIQSQLEPATEWLDPELSDAALLVVIGGDGAVRMVTGSASRCGVPMIQYPAGTENLFAKHFGMKASIDSIRKAIDHWNVISCDMATVNQQRFLLMASVGFDADVVNDLASNRSSSISHLSYLAPILRQAIHWRAPRLDVFVDGDQVLAGGRGLLVVANSPAYARHLDPARQAVMNDGLLDIAFMPAKTALGVLQWAARLKMMGERLNRHMQYFRGTSIRVRMEPASMYQVDGDPPMQPEPVSSLQISIEPGILDVLAPS